jgi:hypothetical protein
MRYNKKLKIKISGKLKTLVKYYLKEEEYSELIRDVLINYLEIMSENVDSEISSFYESIKPRTPEYFKYAKTKGFDDSFEKKYNKKDKKISSLDYINKLHRDLKIKDNTEDFLNNIIEELKKKLKQYENSKG